MLNSIRGRKIQAERALLDQALAHPAGIGEGRQQAECCRDGSQAVAKGEEFHRLSRLVIPEIGSGEDEM